MFVDSAKDKYRILPYMKWSYPKAEDGDYLVQHSNVSPKTALYKYLTDIWIGPHIAAHNPKARENIKKT